MDDIQMFDPLGQNSSPLGEDQEYVGDPPPLDAEGTHILAVEQDRQLSFDTHIVYSDGPAVLETPLHLN